MSVMLVTNAHSFTDQVSSLNDPKDFYDNFSIGSSDQSSTRLGDLTSNSSASSTESLPNYASENDNCVLVDKSLLAKTNSLLLDPPSTSENDNSNSDQTKVSLPACDLVDKSLLAKTNSLLLDPQTTSRTDYNQTKLSEPCSTATETVTGLNEYPETNSSISMSTQQSKPKELFQKSNFSFNYRSDGNLDPGNLVFVSGLSPEVTVSQLVELFGSESLKRNYNGEPDIHIHLDRVTGKSRGQATVGFKSSNLAQSAIKELNDREYSGGRLIVQPYRRRNWFSRRGSGFGYPRGYHPPRCWDSCNHPSNGFHDHVYSDRLLSLSFHEGYPRRNDYRSDACPMIAYADPYLEGPYPRGHVRGDPYSFRRYGSELDSSSGPHFHFNPSDRPWCSDYQRNCFSMGGHDHHFSRRSNNPWDYYPRPSYGRPRMVCDNERLHKSWNLNHARDSNRYPERHSFAAV